MTSVWHLASLEFVILELMRFLFVQSILEWGIAVMFPVWFIATAA